MSRSIEVRVDADLAPSSRVGTLHDDRSQIRFRYDRSWLEGPHLFAVDPDLSLDTEPFFPRPDATAGFNPSFRNYRLTAPVTEESTPPRGGPIRASLR